MKNVKQMLMILNTLILCCSCATSFVKPGASKTDFSRDKNDCTVKVAQAGYHGGDFGANMARKNFFVECMEGQGWAKE